MRSIILISLIVGSATLHASDIPPGAEIFTAEGLAQPMSVETAEYKFSLIESGNSYLVSGSGPDGAMIEYRLPHAEFQTSERLFVLRSYACGTSTVDLILQLGPPEHADMEERNHYRLVFSDDLASVVAKFYDPSVSSVHAVLPLQSVEGIVDADTGRAISCNGTTPSVIPNAQTSP